MSSELLKEINAAPRVALGSLLETVDVRGGTVDHDEIEGVNINKTFVATVANLKNTDLSKYKHVPTFAFATNLMHIGRDVIFPVALNTSRETKFVSPACFVFRIKDGCKLLPIFLLTLFRTSSFDRRVWFATDSSIRGNLTWDDMCRVKIPLPPIEVQQQYVDAYQGLTAIVEQNEALLKSLEETAQACVAECREKWPMVALGKYIEPIDVRNTDLKIKLSQGICNEKYFQNPKQVSKNAKSDKVVRPGQFAYNRATTRNGEKISIALRYGETCTVSSAYQVFQVINEQVLSSEFLLLWFKRKEFDRYARYMSKGSAHEFFEFDDMCRVKIPLPPIEVQQQYVDAYQGLTAIVEQNEALLKSLEETAQACVAECREKWPMVALGKYIEPIDVRNTDLKIKLSQGICNEKYFQNPKQVSKNAKSDKVVRPGQFAYNRATTRNGEKISIALRYGETCTVSSAYQVFQVINEQVLSSEFLLLWFKRKEFDRYARYMSKGSAHEFFEFDDMCRVKIPLPPIEVQRAIVALYHCAEEARKIAAEARLQLTQACPAMIQRASHCR